MDRFLIIRTSSLGDIIHGLPVAAAIKTHLPASRVSWLVEERFKDLFSKPQFAHFNTYLTGLIISANKTVQGINDNFIDRKDQSALNHFITDSEWDEQVVNKRRIELIKEHVEDIPDKDALLVIDDTLSHKSGTKIEEVGTFFDHTTSGYSLGHQVVSSLLSAKDNRFPLDLRVYKKHKEGDQGFKTKIELAHDLIKAAYENKVRFSCVVFDSWFLAHKLVRYIVSLKKYWISQLKTNRIIRMNTGNISVSEFVQSLTQDQFKKIKIKEQFVYGYAQTVTISKLGKVKLVVFYETEDFSDEATVLGSNAHVWTPDKVIFSYKQRWSIETFYKDSKINLGFEDYEMRKLKGIIKHWYLVFAAYTLLHLSTQDKNLMTWFNAQFNTIGDRCRYAASETIQHFVLWIIRMHHQLKDEEKVVSLVFNPKAKVRFTFSS